MQNKKQYTKLKETYIKRQEEYEKVIKEIREKDKVYVEYENPKCNDAKSSNIQAQEVEDTFDEAAIMGWKIEDREKAINQIGTIMNQVNLMTKEMALNTEEAEGKLEHILENTRSVKKNTKGALEEIEITAASRSK